MSTHLNKTHRAMALAFAGYSGFSVSDACVKVLTAKGYSVTQIVTLDSMAAAMFLLMLAPRLGGLASLKDVANAPVHAARIALNTAVNVLLVYCLSFMPIATVYTAVFTKPIMAALIAIPLYGERVGLNRAISIALGLAGILVAFQPWSAAASQTAHIPLLMLTTLVISLSFLLARSLKGTSLLAMAFYPIAGSGLLTLPFMLADFTPIPLGDAPLFILSGLCVACAVTGVSFAFRYADSAAVSPLMYSQMIWGIAFGAFLFGDMPSPAMLAGAGIIAASGIFLLISEKKNAKNTQ